MYNRWVQGGPSKWVPLCKGASIKKTRKNCFTSLFLKSLRPTKKNCKTLQEKKNRWQFFYKLVTLWLRWLSVKFTIEYNSIHTIFWKIMFYYIEKLHAMERLPISFFSKCIWLEMLYWWLSVNTFDWPWDWCVSLPRGSWARGTLGRRGVCRYSVELQAR